MRSRSAGENILNQEYGIGNINGAVAIGVAGSVTRAAATTCSRLRAAGKYVLNQEYGIRDVHGAVIVGISAVANSDVDYQRTRPTGRLLPFVPG